MRRLATLWVLLASACAAPASDAPVVDPATPDDDDSATPDDDDDATAAAIAAYDGPAYTPCVTDAQCDPGSACTTIPGYGGSYCSPPCDEDADCALEGLPWGTSCLPSGRCARACAEGEQVVPDRQDGPKEGSLPEDACPDPLTCRDVDGAALCAGLPAGQAGYYGTCSHPMIEGTDCPPVSACYGGAFIGTEDAGVCLPHCDDGLCPAPADATSVTTLCYDIGFDHPVCALLCTPGVSECPWGQFCFDVGFTGNCAPEGAENPL